MSETNWDALKRAFITHLGKPSVRDFAREHSLTEKTCANRASREKWLELRDDYWENVGTKVAEKLADEDATLITRDISRQLWEIQQMKQAAMSFAGVNQGNAAFYENAAQAVGAYEKLAKLERLLTDQSTENLSVSDGRAIVAQIIQILKEEVHDRATLERIAARFAGLGKLAPGGSDRPTLN